MRIVYVTVWEKDNGGGAGRISYEMARVAAEFNIEVAMIAPGNETKTIKENGITYFFTESCKLKDAFFPNTNQDSINKIYDFLDKFNPDLIHNHCEGFLHTITLNWARKNNKKFVETCHFLPSKIKQWSAIDDKANFLFGLIQKTGIVDDVIKTSLNSCDSVIALNDFAVHDLRDFGYKGTIWKIPNGCFLDDFINIPQITIDKKIFLYFTGYITKRKNQVYLINVLKHLPKKYNLVLVGNTEDVVYVKKIRALVKKFKLGDRVEIIGNIPAKEIPKIISRCNICVSAAKHEVQSLAIIEALAAGRPVVGLSNNTIDELVDEKVGVWLSNKTKPEEFAYVIKKLVNDEQKLYSMALNARDRVAELDWKKVYPLLIRRYSELITNKSDVSEKDNLHTSFIQRGSLFVGKVLYKLLKIVNRRDNKMPDSN